MNWPKTLVSELAARRCLLFLGAGASAGAVAIDGVKHPPLWKSLLGSLRERFEKKEDSALVQELMDKEKYLDVAEVLLQESSSAEFAGFIRDILVTPRFSQSKIHESVLAIDPKVVITTNWDDIYDVYCRTGDAENGYTVVRYYDDSIVSVLRSPVRLVLKAHGCVSDPARIVLTRSHYFRARQSYALFYRVLDSLFLTNTVLFTGYSLTDPDIQLVLENVTIAAPSAHPHYALLPAGTHPALAAAVKESYNIHILEYPVGDYAAVDEALAELAERVAEYRRLYSA